jgi:hypothetical protein
VQCGTITYSTINSANAFSCVCNPGYAWDIFTFTCIPFTGKIVLPQSSYVTCTSIPSATSTTLINNNIARPVTTIKLSDDALFAYLNAGNALYLAEKGYICACASGYQWNESRKRCFLANLGAAF